jgi:hypothetical protein
MAFILRVEEIGSANPASKQVASRILKRNSFQVNCISMGSNVLAM